MSDKPVESALVANARPPTATAQSPSSAQGPALTAEERAERELAKIDEQMDVIMAKPENRAALVNRPDAALQPPGGRSITPGVSAPVEQSGINHLAMNCIVPGLGSLVRGRTGLGLAQMGLAVASVPVLFIKGLWLGLLLAIVAYVWSVASGIGFASQSSNKSWR